MSKTKMIGIRLTPEKEKELKLYLVKNDLSMQQFLERYIDQVLKEDREQNS